MRVCSEGGTKEERKSEGEQCFFDFGSFTRKGLLADLEHAAEIWAGQISNKARGEARGELVEDRKTTDLPAVRE